MSFTRIKEALAGERTVGSEVTVSGGDVLTVPVRARTHRDNASGIMNIYFSVTATDDPGVVMTEDSRFLGPQP